MLSNLYRHTASAIRHELAIAPLACQGSRMMASSALQDGQLTLEVQNL